MANSEINRKTLLTGIIDTNSKSEISIFKMYSSLLGSALVKAMQ